METQKLICAEGVYDALEYGKTITIRKGRRDIQLGSLILESLEAKRQTEVQVNYVMYCKLEDVPDEMLEMDGFIDHANMLECMKNFYPEITYKSEVTVISFYR